MNAFSTFKSMNTTDLCELTPHWLSSLTQHWFILCSGVRKDGKSLTSPEWREILLCWSHCNTFTEDWHHAWVTLIYLCKRRDLGYLLNLCHSALMSVLCIEVYFYTTINCIGWCGPKYMQRHAMTCGFFKKSTVLLTFTGIKNYIFSFIDLLIFTDLREPCIIWVQLALFDYNFFKNSWQSWTFR